MPTLEEAFPATDSAPQQRVSLEQAFPQQRVSLEQAFPKASAPAPASGLANDAIQSHLNPPTGIRGAVNSFISGEGGAGLKLLQGAESIQNMMNGGAVAEMMGAPSTRVFTPERVRGATRTLEDIFPSANTTFNKVSHFAGEAAPGVAAAVVAPEATIPILAGQGAAGGAASAEDAVLNAREAGHPVSPVREKLGVAGGAVAGGAINAGIGALMGGLGEGATGPVERIATQGLLGIPQTVAQNVQQNVTAKIVDPQSKWQQPTPAELGENVLTNTAFAGGGELHGLAARKVSLEQAFPAQAESNTRSEPDTSAAPSPPLQESSQSQPPTAPGRNIPSAAGSVEPVEPSSETSPNATSGGVLPQGAGKTQQSFSEGKVSQGVEKPPRAMQDVQQTRLSPADLELQLRDQVMQHFGPDAADLGSHPMAAAAWRGDQSPGRLISGARARDLAATLPEDHPARITLHNMQEFEKNPAGTRAKTINTNDVPDGTRVVVNDGETFTVDKENQQVRDGITASIPDGGINLTGTKILPPHEDPNAISEDFFSGLDVHNAMSESGVQPDRAAKSVKNLVSLHQQEPSNAALQGNKPGNLPEERGATPQGGASNGGSAKDRAQPAPQEFGDQSEKGVFGQPVITSSGVGQQSGLFHEPVQMEVPREKPVGSTEANKPENTGEMFPRLSGGRQAGAVVLPDVEPLVREARAGAAAIRSEYKPIAIRFGEEPAQHLNRMAAAPNETNSIEASFRRNAFGDDSVTYGKFIELGQHFRGEELESRGKSRGNLPKLTPAEVTARMADPKIKKAINLYNRDVGPFIEGIRNRNAMAMNPNAKSQPFFLNLVGDMEEPSYGGETAASFNKPFNRTATGSGTYETDPITYMRRVIGAHVRADVNAQFKGWVKSKGLPFASLTPVQEPGRPTKFMGKWNGRDVEMTPVDVNQGLKMPVIDPTTKKPVTMASGAMVMTDKTPDMRYVPTAIADKAENIFQRQGPRDTLVDRAMQVGTRLGLTLRGAGHIQRNVAAVAARMSQNPRSIRSFLPSWLGNKGLAAQTMAGMAGTPLGDAMQVGVDRSGGARGTGFNVPEATSKLGKVANLTHDAIMHPTYGSDPNGRRVLANEFYRLALDHPTVDAAERRVAGGESPLKVGDELWNKLTPKQKLDMGQYINTTMGFLNSQSRSGFLNDVTRFFPFAGSEAGMIPNELSRFLSGNVSPKILKTSVQRGQYGRAALQLGGQLASGPVGIFLAMQALNLAGSGINGHPRFTWDNDEGHKLDVELPFTHSGNKNGYVSNLAPDFARASRLLGIKALANKDADTPGEFLKTIGREGVNEAFSALAPTLRQVMSVALGKELYWDKHGKQPDEQMGSGVPLIGHTLQSMQRGQGAGVGMAQDVAALAGYNATQSSGKNYTPAQRMAHDILQQNSGGFQLSDDQRQRHADRQALIESIRATPDKTGELMQQALKDGKIPRSEAMSVIRESRRGDLENAIEQMSAEQAMQVYDAGSDDEKKKIKVLVQQKVYRAKTLTPQKKRELMQQVK